MEIGAVMDDSINNGNQILSAKKKGKKKKKKGKKGGLQDASGID
jgi:hypothetical protein